MGDRTEGEGHCENGKGHWSFPSHVVRISPGPSLRLTILLARARAALATKDYQAAVTASQQAIGTDDRRWEAYAIAANAYTGQRLYGDAIESLCRRTSWRGLRTSASNSSGMRCNRCAA